MSIWCVLLCTSYTTSIYMRTAFLYKYSYDSSLVLPRSTCSIPGTSYSVHPSTKTGYSIRGTVICFARKKPCQQLLPHYRCLQVLQVEQRLPNVAEKEKRSFPRETWIHCEGPPRVESAANAEVAGSPLPLLGPFLTKKQITIRDLFTSIVNHVSFCHDSR